MFKKVVFLVVIAALFLLSYQVLVLYIKAANKKVMSHPKMYCYETFRGPANSTLYINDLSDSIEYIKYYKNVQKGENPIIKFPINGLPTDEIVYVQRYLNSDSSLAEVVSYYQSPLKSRPFFLRCYVYSSTLHTFPPEKTK